MKLWPNKGAARLVLAACLSLAAVGLALWSALELIPDPLLEAGPDPEPSLVVEDRAGRPLREFLSSLEARTQWTGLNDLSPHLVSAALAAEDRRFFYHPGVDPLALARAAWQNLWSGRVLSGASTITMQLARILTPGPRTWRQKLLEIALALRLEKTYTKREILEQYLNRAPCGNLANGLPAAARLYLGKSPAVLSPAEAAFLMALPQAPGALNPYRGHKAALVRRNQILDRMAESGRLSPDEAQRARIEPLHLSRRGQVFFAPHFTTYVRSLLPRAAAHRARTTLDLDLQLAVERLTAQAVTQAGGQGLNQAAVIILDHRTREVLAWVGSKDFFEDREGQNDGVLAKRQPGSALKPFIYAAAFDAGLTPATIVADRPVEFGLDRGVYSPANYNGRYHGEVTLRTALASSLNVPAVKVLRRVGLARVLGLLRETGLTSLDRDPDYYGLGLTLGGGEVSLLELANAYATLADGGVYRPPVFFRPAPATEEGRPVFSPQVAYLVTHILGDDAARANGFGRDSLLCLPFPVAAKTGTSKNFRDNWCVGYTSSLVAAVWAGNFDGRPMGHVSGITGAGPLWHQVMRLCAAYSPPEPFPRPEGLIELEVCAETGELATEYCPNRRLEIFSADHRPEQACPAHRPRAAGISKDIKQPDRLAIVNPRSGERYLQDPGLEDGFQNLQLKASGPDDLDWLVWRINGEEVGRVQAGRKPLPAVYWPLRKGELTISLVGEKDGRAIARDQVHITVH
ncbi:MAG: penicillin-binding protein 1C [Thermodesulfobacteriota bacterium]